MYGNIYVMYGNICYVCMLCMVIYVMYGNIYCVLHSFKPVYRI